MRRPRNSLPPFSKNRGMGGLEIPSCLGLVLCAQQEVWGSPQAGPISEHSRMRSPSSGSQSPPRGAQPPSHRVVSSRSNSGHFELARSSPVLSSEASSTPTRFRTYVHFQVSVFVLLWRSFLFKSLKASLRILRDTKRFFGIVFLVVSRSGWEREPRVSACTRPPASGAWGRWPARVQGWVTPQLTARGRITCGVWGDVGLHSYPWARPYPCRCRTTNLLCKVKIVCWSPNFIFFTGKWGTWLLDCYIAWSLNIPMCGYRGLKHTLPGILNTPASG